MSNDPKTDTRPIMHDPMEIHALVTRIAQCCVDYIIDEVARYNHKQHNQLAGRVVLTIYQSFFTTSYGVAQKAQARRECTDLVFTEE